MNRLTIGWRTDWHYAGASCQPLNRVIHLRDESLKKASNLAGKLVNEAVRKNVINLNKFGG